MTRRGRVAAQAKINVWLHVGRRDESGFHEIATLFHRVDLADTVTVTVRADSVRTCACTSTRLDLQDLGPMERNLAYRAASTFADTVGWPSGFDVLLEKRIPVGGGLGGGSADAGAVLRVLNAIAPKPVNEATLLAMAEGLGSDVPFLASRMVLALGWGRGERLEDPGLRLPAAEVALIVPAFGIRTADAYQWLDAMGARSLEVGRLGQPPSVQPGWEEMDLGNDFEEAVEPRFPEIAGLRRCLVDGGATVARLSGSGSTVFGIFPNGIPAAFTPPPNTTVVRTRTSTNVVPVEVLE